jgi:hypothetical protein
MKDNMKDKLEKDKQLLENLDRVLTGKDDKIAEPLDEDTRSALEFARKMKSLKEAPSKEFAKNLKAQLVHQLAEQENKEQSKNQELLFWGIPRRKLWQGTIAAAIVVIIAAIILLITVVFKPGSSSGTTVPDTTQQPSVVSLKATP